MSTPHNEAKMGDIAQTVLMPGDPLRAKYIAETFLEDVVCYNKVRNSLGYTGTWKGHRVSVQGTGMGIPSTAIYATEFVKDYGVKNLIRVGSCGGMAPEVKIRDIVIASSATTDSSFIHNIFGGGIYYAPTADFKLLLTAYEKAQDLGLEVKVGDIFSADRFYNDEIDIKKLADYGVLGTEMESAVLYTIAAKYKARALSICTVSDQLITGEATTPEERQTSFNDMMVLALDTAIAMEE